jgi:protein involved in polysaccharide export with SLBB domain
LLFLVLFLLFSGCSSWVSPSRMYKVDRKSQLLPPEQCLELKEHIISVDDELSVIVYSNNAQVLLNPEPGQTAARTGQDVKFRVLKDGTIYLPAIGPYAIAGKTITEAENSLRQEYASFIIDPFVSLEVTNKRVFVYKGGRNSASSSVEIDNPNATLIEALSKSGGLGEGRSDKIYLIRNLNGQMQMYLIDLSASENSHFGNIVLQSNDIIYVSPQLLMSRRVLEEISPLLSIMNTFLLIINLFK